MLCVPVCRYLSCSIHFSEFMPIFFFTRKRTKHENPRSLPFSYHTKMAADKILTKSRTKGPDTRCNITCNIACNGVDTQCNCCVKCCRSRTCFYSRNIARNIARNVASTCVLERCLLATDSNALTRREIVV